MLLKKLEKGGFRLLLGHNGNPASTGKNGILAFDKDGGRIEAKRLCADLHIPSLGCLIV
jgi:hypothetical protein